MSAPRALVLAVVLGPLIACTHATATPAMPRTPFPSVLSAFEGSCDHDTKTDRVDVRCRDGHMSIAIFNGRSPSTVVYPTKLLAHVLFKDGLSGYCALEPDGQTIFVDGRNVWVHSLRHMPCQRPNEWLLVADRTRMSRDDVRLLREALGLPPTADVRDDGALKAALDALPEAELTRHALAKCAARRSLDAAH